MTQEALRMAFEAMNAMLTHMGMDEDEWNKVTFDQMRQAIKAAEEALAQTQEPVALETLLKWDDDIDPIGEVVGFIEGSPYIMVKVHKGKQVSLDDDLYATPPQRTWQGLTDEDRQAAFESMPDMLDGFLKTWGWLHFSKAIEAKLKEKNA